MDVAAPVISEEADRFGCGHRQTLVWTFIAESKTASTGPILAIYLSLNSFNGCTKGGHARLSNNPFAEGEQVGTLSTLMKSVFLYLEQYGWLLTPVVVNGGQQCLVDLQEVQVDSVVASRSLWNHHLNLGIKKGICLV